MAHVSLRHVAAGCNRVSNALHWGDNGLVAYAAHHTVMVWDPEAEGAVLTTIVGHGDCVNCVRWFSGADWGLPPHAAVGAPALLAAGAGDGAVTLWLWLPTAPEAPWRLGARLAGHSAPVTSVVTHRDPGGGVVLVSTAGDGEVLVWHGVGGGPEAAAEPDAWTLAQRLSLGPAIQHCAALAPLPLSPAHLLLALGGVHGSVRLLLRPPGGEFGGGCRLVGHQDWVRGLAFTLAPDGRLLLASASQDKYIRVWAVAPKSAAAAAAGGATSTADAIARYAPKPQLAAGGAEYAATLEALLVGHEDWVHSVAWQPAGCGGDGEGGAADGGEGEGAAPCLLSASMDHTMMVWRPDRATGLWLSEAAVGEAGPNHLGYFTGTFSPDGAAILAHGFTGALHLWRRHPGGGRGWAPGRAPGGHWGPVVDATWAVDGRCLLTVSTDQTARVIAEVEGAGWCEIARSQVHGHDFSCVAALPPGTPSAAADPSAGRPAAVYASGSEEKVIRVFQEPSAFTATLDVGRGRLPPGRRPTLPGAFGATLPALGLSNKAVFAEAGAGSGGAAEGGGYTDGPDIAPAAAPSVVAGPPLEEHLSQNTLWPEAHKLYGHGNELYCLAADPRGRYLASACRAQSAAAAEVWLWDARQWTPAGALPAHGLTVTQLAFSPCGAFLASASRDRTVALFRRTPEGLGGGAAAPPFELVARVKAHARIVWALHWSPDSALLATASRDGSVKLWSAASLAGGGAPAPAPVATAKLGDSVRSVAFAPAAAGPGHLLAAGLESGGIVLLRVLAAGAAGAASSMAEVSTLWTSSRYTQHAAAVRRLCWREAPGYREGAAGSQGGQLELASCGDDHSVKVFRVTV